MYAVVRDRGRQYRVKKGDKLEIDRVDLPAGGVSKMEEVLLIGGLEKGDLLGTPLVKGASVQFKVLGEIRGPKKRIFHIRRRENYRKRMGHRQNYTRVEIQDIVVPK
jgi:large subunit ribosomal protein L21